MQSRKHEITVMAGDADGDKNRTIGTGLLVASDRVLLVLDDRASAPALPLHVLVPVAAGGDRDEHINVTEVVHPAADAAVVGLQLEREVSVSVDPDPEMPQHLRAVLGEDVGPDASDGDLHAAASLVGKAGRTGGSNWWCRLFPQWCR